jgi:hypothetical protein
MADDTSRNINEEKEFLELQKQIKAAAKDAGKSLSNAGDYTKTILKNYVEIQRMSAKISATEKEINKLLADGTEESKKKAAVLQQEVAELKKQKEQIKAINKEMVSLNSVARMGLSAIVSYIGQAITGYLDFSQKVKDASAEIGYSADRMWMVQQNISQAGVQMQRFGVSTQDAVAAQLAYSNELGRAVVLSQDALTNMAMIGKATGLGMQGMAELTSQMDAFGLGAEHASGIIYDIYSETSAMGLNAGKVIKGFQQNIGLLNRLHFKGGIAGLAKMAQIVEKYKLDMNDIAAASEKAFRPEGAIEMAAKLQVLGGSLAGLGDPFQLMYKARNNPEKFAEDIAKAARQSAKFDPKTGEFEVSAYEMDRLREASEATGISMEKLVESAKAGAKIDLAKEMLSTKNLSPEDKDALATMSTMGKNGKAQIQIGLDASGKADIRDLSELTSEQLQTVIQEKKNAKERADQVTGISERWDNFLQQLIVAVYPLFTSIEKYITPMLSMLTEKTTGWAESIKNFLSTFDFSKFIEDIKDFFVGLWDKLKWIGEHWKLALGIAATAFVGYWLISQIAAGAIFGKSAGAAFRASSGMGLGGMSKGGGGGMTGAQTAMQGQAAKSAGMGSMMKSLGSAAQILAIAGAMWILADALIKFNDVEWSSLVKGGIALIGFSLGLKLLQPILGSFGGANIWQGIAAMLALGVATVLLGAGLFLMGQVPLANLIVGFLGLIGVLLAFSALSLSGVGWAGVGLVLALGAAMLMIGAAVYIASAGLSMIQDNIMVLGVGLFLAGAGFLAMAAGIGILTISLIALGAASLLALPGLLILGAVSGMLVSTVSALNASGGPAGLTAAINAINSVDEGKLEALKDLSMWMALLGGTTTVKFDESLKIDGNISLSGSGGGKSDTEWAKDPQFMAELQELITRAANKQKNGGKF